MLISKKATVPWSAIEAAIGDIFKYKPYRPRQQLLQELASEYKVAHALKPTHHSWQKEVALALECIKRLKRQEKPSIWLAQMVSWQLVQPGVLMKDMYKTSPTSGRSLELYRCTRKKNGFLWDFCNGDCDVRLESDLVAILCNLIGCSTLHAPSFFVDGPFIRSIVSRLRQPLYDTKFVEKLDGEDLATVLKDGTVLKQK